MTDSQAGADSLSSLAHKKEKFQNLLQFVQSSFQTECPESSHLKTHEQIKALVEKHSPLEYQERFIQELCGFGPVEALLADSHISEIIINGPEKILYEKRGKLHQLTDHFLSELSFQNFIHRISEEAGVVLTLNQPFQDGNWKGWRIHLARAPLVHVAFHVSLRRHPRQAWTFNQLKNHEWAPAPAIQLIRQLLEEKSNMLICGPTSSGKTSVLNACLQCLSPEERVILIEDSDELLLPNPFSTKLMTRPASQESLVPIEQSELVRQSLRMRPDRIIMGEARGGEAKDLLMALATGHKGSLGTIHAKNHKQALSRLEMLIQIGAPAWSTHTIRQMILLSIDHLIILERAPQKSLLPPVPLKEKSLSKSSSPAPARHSKQALLFNSFKNPAPSVRKLQGIYKLAGVESTGFLFEALFVNELNSQFQDLLAGRGSGSL